MNKILFVLPGPSSVPIGGYKIVYEYAKRLSVKYDVDIGYLLSNPFDKKRSWWKVFKIKLRYMTVRLDFYKWFDFDRTNIRHILLDTNDERIKKYDLLFATSVETAYYINDLNLNKDVLYLIQGFEKWATSKKKLIDSYSFNGFKNVVISKWLKEVLEKEEKKVFLHISNPINHNSFYVENLLEKKQFLSIAMMYHKAPDKGSDKGINAVKSLKKQYASLQVTLFSVYDRPDSLPEWINFVKEPTTVELRYIYNNHTFFFNTSTLEGFGLAPAEAMACGSCVITSNSGGVLDFCINDKTAIVLENNDSRLFISAFTDIIENKAKINKLTTNGVAHIKKTDWNKNLIKLDEKINEILN